MYRLNSLQSKAKRKKNKRVGRGSGSGHGTYSGRGLKGQKARSGGSIPPGFEGGRMPLIRQLPKKRGFTSRRIPVQPINLSVLEKVYNDDEVVNPKTLAGKGLVGSSKIPIKILGKGSLNKKLKIESIPVSKSARTAIEKAGGSID